MIGFSQTNGPSQRQSRLTTFLRTMDNPLCSSFLLVGSSVAASVFGQLRGVSGYPPQLSRMCSKPDDLMQKDGTEALVPVGVVRCGL